MPEGTGWLSIVTGSMEKEAADLAALLRGQAARDRTAINLIASECYAPRACLEAEASLLANKNTSGYPARHSIGDSTVLDQVEQLAIDRAKKLFGAEHANVQAYSATIANVAVLRALLEKGDRILAFDKMAGGHSSHGSDQHVAGQDYEARFFAIDETSGDLDLASIDRLAHEFRPRMIIAGSSNYPRRIDFQALHEIAQRVGAMLFADVAHVAGLIVAGLHPNPAPFADVVTTSTHKTLCGPRAGGLILAKSKYADAIDAALNPGLQDSPAAHIMAGRAVLFALVTKPQFRNLMEAVVANAQVLAETLRDRGIRLYTGGTDTHMVVVDLRGTDWQSADLVARLARHRLIANSTTLAPRAETSGRLGLRLGTVAMTSRGVDAEGFAEIGNILAEFLTRGSDSDDEQGLRSRATALAEQNPVPDY